MVRRFRFQIMRLEERIAPDPVSAPVTPATTIHGLPGNNPAYGGASANPDGGGFNGGDGIHGIDNVPGQSDTNPGGAGGFAEDGLDQVHGGIGEYNPVAAD